MSIFDNFLFRRLLGILPDWSDAEETQTFLLSVNGFCDTIAAETDNKIDDAVCDAVDRLLQNEKAWAAIHGLVMDLLATDAGDVLPAEDDPRVLAIAEEDPELDPITIIAIISAIIQAIQWWKNR